MTTSEIVPVKCKWCNKWIDSKSVKISYHTVNSETKQDLTEYAHTKCDTLKMIETYERTKIITTRLYTAATLEQYDRGRKTVQKLATKINSFDIEYSAYDDNAPEWIDSVVSDMRVIEALEREWEMAVWFGGKLPTYYSLTKNPNPGSLQEFVQKAPYKGYSATVGDNTYHSYTICGRSQFQIECKEHYVNLILDETGTQLCGGIQGIYAPALVAYDLIEQATNDWKAGLIHLKKSDVGII